MGNTADGVYVVDAKQRIVFWNHGMETLLGYSAGDVLGRSCFEVLCRKTKTGRRWCRPNCPNQRAVKRGTPVQNSDLLTRTKTGAPLWTNISILAFPRNKGTWTVHIAHASRTECLEEGLRQIQRTLRSLHLAGNESNRMGEHGNPHNLPHSRTGDRFPSLTRRELEVLGLLLRGLSTSAIAEQLHISMNTLRNHLRHLLAKTGTHTRSQLVLRSLENGGC